MARDNVKERKRVLNQVNATGMTQARMEEYQRQQKEEEARLAELAAKPFYFKNRPNPLFKGSSVIVFLMTLLLIANSVGRGFVGTYWYILPNLVFLVAYLSAAKLINPLNFASDNRDYLIPKVNYFYTTVRKTASNMLKFVGKHLEKQPRQSLNTAVILTVVGSVIGLLFYGSAFSIIALPSLILYVVRVFASNSFRDEVSALAMRKWLLFGLLVIQAGISIFWKTPFDYGLFVIISLMNAIGVFFRNTYIYTTSEIEY